MGSSKGLLSVSRFLAVFFAVISCSHAADPAWWTRTADETAFIDPAASHSINENYAPANLGQLKNVAHKAKKYLDLYVPGGAGTEVNTLVQGFTSSISETTLMANLAPVNLGQVKAVAKPFYDRLMAAGYKTKQNLINRGYPSGWSSDYPWLATTPLSENYAPANLGQLKAVFSFDVWGSLLISPRLAPLKAGVTHTFTAIATNASGVPVTSPATVWTVSAGGTIGSSTGIFSAATAGVYTVTATKGALTASTKVTVYTPALTGFTIEANQSLIKTGQSVGLSAEGEDQYGNSFDFTGTVWSVVSGGGSISGTTANATYTAGSAGATVTIKAVKAGVEATTTVEVYLPVLTTFSISGTDTVLRTSSPMVFTAVGLDQHGSSFSLSSGMTWSVVSGGGSFTGTPAGATATYNSGTTASVVTIKAKKGTVETTTTVEVYVAAIDSLTLEGNSGTMRTSTSMAFTAAGLDQKGKPITLSGMTWSIVSGGGSFTGTPTAATATYNSGTTATTATIKVKKGTKEATASVIVYVPVMSLTITPTSVTVPVSSTQTFSATAKDQYNRTMTATFTWTRTGVGSISGSGSSITYSSGASAGSATVKVTVGSLNATANVTVQVRQAARVEISPQGAIVLAGPGSKLQYTADCYDQFDASISSPVTWSVTPAAGTISSTGLLTTGTTAGTYTVTGTSGSGSDTAEVTVVTGLTAPTGLEAEARYTRVVLSWDDYFDFGDGTSFDHYNVYRATSSGGPFTDVADITTQSPSKHIDRGLTTGTTYWYYITVVHKDEHGNKAETPASNIVSATPVPIPLVGPMDVAFILDNTGSMDDSIDNIRFELQDIISDIAAASSGSYRLALLTPDTEISNTRLEFSSANGTAFSAALNGDLDADGVLAPESTDLCLKNLLAAGVELSGSPLLPTTAPFRTPFRTEAKKVILMITDALPSGGNDIFIEDENLVMPTSDEYRAHRYAKKAAALGIQIACVAVEGGALGTPAFERIMEDYYAGFTTPPGKTPIYITVPSNGIGAASAVLDVIEQSAP
ncbi:Ig-like domain-containing protein [Luteolibacter yonseiensis]|uniref:Ig-like domain-containing protein n=1 Tax=Luteolibacter yonseiensis TaxID=1144680 RepID=A0A934R5T5_9BACT|nr:Ig-like domain-containing protein [Luteolibacter yonseiensis]MBK1816917.1 Ig-like domain-containing protein [Luteolibacter yonseiensis]